MPGDQAIQYRETAIRTANPLELVVMLYEGAIQSLRQAQTCMLGKDIAGRSRAVNRATAMISELQASLSFEHGGEIATSLDRLYTYMKERIFKGNVEQDPKYLAEVVRLLENLNSAWSELARAAGAKARAAERPRAAVQVAGNAPSTAYASLNISG